MRKKLMKKTKNVVLKTITTCMALQLFFALCALYEFSIIPAILCIISVAWLELFSRVNGFV